MAWSLSLSRSLSSILLQDQHRDWRREEREPVRCLYFTVSLINMTTSNIKPIYKLKLTVQYKNKHLKCESCTAAWVEASKYEEGLKRAAWSSCFQHPDTTALSTLGHHYFISVFVPLTAHCHLPACSLFMTQSSPKRAICNFCLTLIKERQREALSTSPSSNLSLKH